MPMDILWTFFCHKETQSPWRIIEPRKSSQDHGTGTDGTTDLLKKKRSSEAPRSALGNRKRFPVQRGPAIGLLIKKVCSKKSGNRKVLRQG